MTRSPFRLTFAAAIVAASLPASNAVAQQSASCQRLIAMADEAGVNISDEFDDVRTVGEADDPNQCSLYVARVTSAGGLMSVDGDEANANAQTDTTTETETTTETVDIAEEATIQGEVEVSLPDPSVQVEQDPAEIAVRTPPPEVNVSQGQPTITVRQAQPIITVQMTQPTITVEQPAPEIVVTMPDPDVNLAMVQPIVDVTIPEPRVTVTQGQPRLAVDLETEVGATANDDTSTQLDRNDDGDGNMVVTATGLSSGASEPPSSTVREAYLS